MAVVGNLTVLMSMDAGAYTGPLNLAKRGTKEFNETTERLNISGRNLDKLFANLNKSYFESLPLTEQLAEEQRALFQLWNQGVIDGQAHGRLLAGLDAKYKQLTESTREYKEAAKEVQRVQDQISKIEQQALTPDQRFNEQLREIEQLKQAGLSTQGQNFLFEKAFQQLQKDTGVIDDATRSLNELNASIDRGVAVARPYQQEVERLEQQKRDLAAANNAGEISEDEYRRQLQLTQQTINQLKFDTEDLARRRRQAQQDAARFAEEALSNDERFAREQQRIRDAIDLGGLDPTLREGLEDSARQRVFAQDIRDRTQAQNEFNRSAQRGLAIADTDLAQKQEIAQREIDLSNARRAGLVSRERFNELMLVEAENLQALQTGQRTSLQLDQDAAALTESLITPRQQLARVQANYTTLLRTGRISQEQFNEAMRRSRREIIGARGAVAGLVAQLETLRTVSLSLGAAAIFYGIFNIGREAFDFEVQIKETLAVFKSARQLSEQEAEGIRQAALDASTLPTNRFNAVEAAEALEKLARDNVDAAVAAKLLPSVLSFATAAQADFAEAVDLSSEVVKAFKIESEDAEIQVMRMRDTMNLMAKASTLSSSDITQLSQAMIKASPEARNLDLSMQETISTILALSEVGRKGQVGGNEFRIAFRDLTKAFSENRELFDQFNIRVFDAEERFVGTAEAIDTLSAALDRLSPQDRRDLVKALGFADKGAQFQLQLRGAADEIRRFNKELDDTDKFARELAEDSLTNTTKVLKSLKGEVTEFINLNIVQNVENVSGAVLVLNEYLDKAVNTLGKFTDKIQVLDVTSSNLRNTLKSSSFNVVPGFQQQAIASDIGGAIEATDKLVRDSKFFSRLLGLDGTGAFGVNVGLKFLLSEASGEETERVKAAGAAAVQNINLELQQLAERLKEQNQTPLEQLRQQLLDIDSVAKETFDGKPLIDERTRIRALSSAIDQYTASLGAADAERQRLNSAADILGSGADFAGVFTVRASDPDNVQRRMLDEQVRTGGNIETILQLIEQWVSQQSAEEEQEFNFNI